MTDLARTALLACLALPAGLSLPALALAPARAETPAIEAAAASVPDAAPARPARHRRHRHAALKRIDAVEAQAGAAEGKGDDKPARSTKAAKPAGSGPTVLGDSIGIGLSMASGAPRLAHEGVAIRSAAALAQLHRVPDRSVVVLSLGTNDAVGSIRGVEGAIDRIRAVAERDDLRVVWLGPPCVFKSWNGTAERLDAVLKERLGADSRVRYVSAADPAVCDRSLRAGDGVHFTMRGYAMLWKRVVAAEGDWAARPAREAAARMPERAPDRTASNER